MFSLALKGVPCSQFSLCSHRARAQGSLPLSASCLSRRTLFQQLIGEYRFPRAARHFGIATPRTASVHTMLPDAHIRCNHAPGGVFANVEVPHINLWQFAWSARKRLSELLMNPDAPENLSEVRPALSTTHKSISATQMPETHLQTNYRTGAAAMFHVRSVLYF